MLVAASVRGAGVAACVAEIVGRSAGSPRRVLGHRAQVRAAVDELAGDDAVEGRGKGRVAQRHACDRYAGARLRRRVRRGLRLRPRRREAIAGAREPGPRLRQPGLRRSGVGLRLVVLLMRDRALRVERGHALRRQSRERQAALRRAHLRSRRVDRGRGAASIDAARAQVSAAQSRLALAR